ncbi:hypothetical protein E2C01_029050 [Portunus trituberculatus]|uniref:Uncharacterized protein n=1 Tax=Portunus trituberculatus TaxID=210409 RepID=A0A5B7ETM6_PORTR|nr:hypothetical protein [Portunus trituberculatus]
MTDGEFSGSEEVPCADCVGFADSRCSRVVNQLLSRSTRIMGPPEETKYHANEWLARRLG